MMFGKREKVHNVKCIACGKTMLSTEEKKHFDETGHISFEIAEAQTVDMTPINEKLERMEKKLSEIEKVTANLEKLMSYLVNVLKEAKKPQQ